MTKVYIDRDLSMGYFMWDTEVLDILPQPEHLLIDVPDALIYEYKCAVNRYGEIQDRLRDYYESKRTNQKT